MKNRLLPAVLALLGAAVTLPAQPSERPRASGPPGHPAAWVAPETPGGDAGTPDWNRIGQEGVDNLRQYLQFDTQNPPDRVAAAASFLRRLLEKEGFEVRIFESGEGKVNLLTRLPAAGKPAAPRKPILLLNHMDVVPVDASRWKTPPFGAVVSDGNIWARGAMDMKGPGMIQMMALIALKRAAVPLDRDLLLLATADEETGGDFGAKWMMEHHWAEIEPEYVFDEGGFGTRDVLAPGKLVYGISVADKRPYWLRVTATGTSGHGSQPIPDNANAALIEALGRILARPQPVAAIPLVETMRAKIGRFAGNKFTNAIQRNTISLTTLRAGVGEPPKANVIPSRSEATLDCRLLPGQSPEEFLAGLKAIAGEKVRFEAVHLSEPALISSTETPLYQAMERVLRRHSPDSVVAPIMVPYGTDGNKFRNRGITVYGFTPVVIDLATIGALHSDQEQIPVEEFKKGIRILYDILADFAGPKR